MYLFAYTHILFIFHFSLWLEIKCLVAFVVVEEEWNQGIKGSVWNI